MGFPKLARLLGITLLLKSAGAQVATSRIEGTVLDPSGAVVWGATVKARGESTGCKAATSSDQRGFFVLPSLPPGTYELTAEAAGFRQTVVAGVEVRVAETATVRISLQIGTPGESITVKAEQSLVQLADAQGGAVADQRDIDALPQVERNPVRLAIFQPGVQISAGTLGQSRINGTRQGSQAPRLDGVDVSEPVSPGLGFIGVPASDSIQEFRVLTHSAKAEYGRAGGAQIEMVSRSGTNQWHGTLYHFHRNTSLNANEFFNNAIGNARPKLIYNSFGGTLGGPVRPNQTFLFASYSGLRSRQDIVPNRLVLTPEAKTGLFRWRTAGTVQSFDIARNDPRGLGIDAAIARDLALLPPPNNFDHPMSDGLNRGGFRFNNPGAFISNVISGRLDHSLSERLRLFLRVTSFADTESTDVINKAAATFPGQPQGLLVPSNRGLAIGVNWTVSPVAITEIRVGRQTVGLDFERPARLEAPMVVTNAWTSPLNPDFRRGRSTTITSAAAALTFIRGSHIWKSGLERRSLRINSFTTAGAYPDVVLTRANGNNVPAGIGPQPGTIAPADLQRFGDFYNNLLGRMSSVSRTFYSDLSMFLGPGVARERNFRAPELHGFLQNDWRVRPNLMLNLGFRYEFYGVPSERDGLQGTLDRAAELGGASQIRDLTVTRTNPWYGRDRNNLAPRAGLVWDPTGKGTTAIRMSYGIYYDPMIGSVLLFIDDRTPGFASTQAVLPNSQPGSDRRVSDGIPVPVAPGAPLLRPPEQRNLVAAVFDPRLRTGYVQHYSVSLQREIGRGVLAEAAWVGNRGIKLLQQTMPNQRKIEGDFLDAFRELQEFRARGTAPSAANTLVRLFGSPQAAVAALSDAIIDEGSAGLAADTVDRSNYFRYPAAGLSPYYIRNYPQFDQLFVGTNDGRGYYDSLQLSLRRRAGAARFELHYTFSKSIDLLSNSGAALEGVIDQFNLRLNRARADFDRPHVLSGFATWTLPFGKRLHLGSGWPPWLKAVAGGWQASGIGVWESGSPFTVRSGRQTAGAAIDSFADYSGDRNIGRVQRCGGGVYFFTPDEITRFSVPAAGGIGTAGRNTFRGPGLFNIDLSLRKRFRVTKRQTVSFRAEAYNSLNHPNFANPGASLASPLTLGKINSGPIGLTGAPIGETFGGPRVVQLALRWEL